MVASFRNWLNDGTPLSWGMLTIPLLLVTIYAFLSYISLLDQAFFFESMAMPTPNHDFLIWSWGGKNTAIWVALLLAILSRQRLPLVIMLLALVVMQLGDINAGIKTDVDVFVTYLALGLVVVEIFLLFYFTRTSSRS